MAAIAGTGTTITFGTSGFSANLLSIGGISMERGSLQTSYMGTSADHTFIPLSLTDNGEVEIEFEFNGDDDPPISDAAETVTIDVGGQGVGFKPSCTAFMTNYSASVPLEDKCTATATLKVSGDWTWG